MDRLPTAQSKSEPADVEQLYMRDIRPLSLLTASEEKELARLVQQGSQNARNKMIESNLRLVVKIARRYNAVKLSLMDLIEEGNIGLMHAVEKFDPEKGFRFSTYASWWIRHEIERALMNQSRTVRLPVHVVRKINKCRRVSYELVQSLQHEPSLQELADRSDEDIDRVSQLLNLNRSTASMDEPFKAGAQSSYSFLDALENTKAENPMAAMQQREVARLVREWLGILGDKPREIITRRFGLGRVGPARGEPQTLEQVAEAVGLTRERVRQIQIQALQKLQTVLCRTGYSWDDVSLFKE